MTVIYSNWHDDDTTHLQCLWKDVDCKLIELTSQSVDWEDIVDNAISNEDDTLILVGHGTVYGLLFPSHNFDTYIIHDNNVHLIHAKNVICCWCYASTFCEKHNLKSFATSMFITNINEAYDNGIYNMSQDMINANTDKFYGEVNMLIKDNIPLNEWVMRLGAHMDVDNPVDTFNRQGLINFF